MAIITFSDNTYNDNIVATKILSLNHLVTTFNILVATFFAAKSLISCSDCSFIIFFRTTVLQISLRGTYATIHQLKKKKILELCFFLYNFSVKWEKKNMAYSCIPIVLSN